MNIGIEGRIFFVVVCEFFICMLESFRPVAENTASFAEYT